MIQRPLMRTDSPWHKLFRGNITLALFLAIASPPVLRPADYRIESWTADNGLPVSAVNRVLQTRDGYLWLATFAGLVRYNGSNFEAYNTANTSELRTSRFTHLVADRAGGFWAPTEGQGI